MARACILLASVLMTVACTTTAQPTTTSTTSMVVSTTVSQADDLGRVVVLGEEVLLADVLALGVTPVASSATVEAVGFQGIEGYDTSGVEVLGMTTLSLEHLASLDPDLIVTFQFWVEQIGEETLEGIADVVAIFDGLDSESRVNELAEFLGREVEAGVLLDRLETARETADAAIADDCEVSMAAIYAGPSVAAFVEPVWEMPVSVTRTGCTLVPDSGQASPDQNGRAFLSLEQLDLLRGPTLLMLQTDTVDGEADAVEEIQGSDLWAALPAVENQKVHVFDRLGYPGAEGQINFLEELVPILND